MKEPRRWTFLAGTLLRLCLGVLFLASLIHPATREVQVLCARLLLRFLPLGGNVYVWDQSKYEWLHEMPRASFTDSFRAEALANAGRSADDLVLALSLMPSSDVTLDAPLPGDLDGHPLLPWIAIAYVEASALQADRHRRDPTWQPPQGRLSEMLARAQRAHPGNGALWLAEGAVRLHAGREAEGLDALRAAVEKGNWDCQTAAAFLHRFRLFVAHGLPQLEAAHDALWGCSVSWQLPARLAGYFEDQMAKAVASHDDARFSALLAVLIPLAPPTWLDDDRSLFHRFCVCKFDLEAAMFARLKQEFPDKWRSDPTDYMATENSFDADAVRSAYLATYAGPQAARESASACAAASQAAQKAGPVRGYSDPHWQHRCEVGRLAFILQALIVTVFLLHLPSRFFHTDSLIRGWLPRNASFWVATGAAVVLATALLTSAFVATTRITDCRFGLVWDALLEAAAVVLWWSSCKLIWLSKHPGCRLVPMTAVVLGFAYLGTVAATAHFRAELLRAILAVFTI